MSSLGAELPFCVGFDGISDFLAIIFGMLRVRYWTEIQGPKPCSRCASNPQDLLHLNLTFCITTGFLRTPGPSFQSDWCSGHHTKVVNGADFQAREHVLLRNSQTRYRTHMRLRGQLNSHSEFHQFGVIASLCGDLVSGVLRSRWSPPRHQGVTGVFELLVARDLGRL